MFASPLSSAVKRGTVPRALVLVVVVAVVEEGDKEEGVVVVVVVAVVADELNHAMDTVPTFGISLPEKTNYRPVNTNPVTVAGRSGGQSKPFRHSIYPGR